MFPIFYSEKFLQHRSGRFHPERPERLQRLVATLQKPYWQGKLQWHTPTAIEERSPLPFAQWVHAQEYIDRVAQISQNGGGRLDPDTGLSASSYEVALLGINAWMDGVEQVLGSGSPAFVLSRPPGHHALSNRGMGFCIFANAAIAAHYALKRLGVKRVAILDWDVHHGNGTQALIESSPEIAYCSLHESPHYPGTGDAHERGDYNNVLNVPMPPGSGIQEYRVAFRDRVLPFLKSWHPDLLVVSAGYDAHAADPLASILLQAQDFGELTDYVLEITPYTLFGLEGGYELDALTESVTTTIERCLALGHQPSQSRC
ncbi:histone deacetylase [Geitlerinema sp. PCC 9228]|jgi:acetoin utilization deacetylase AcuC-like enzyme|uniref:histone deacetylase family protein n=1 Tax=Geitlerinema sp. PCC 9228 TaxID=111611 RepID=UPI0008F9B1B0|nr:histone deacetylase [Geitlerinema sp. PCC 9228]